jgi:hypothetical protein
MDFLVFKVFWAYNGLSFWAYFKSLRPKCSKKMKKKNEKRKKKRKEIKL